MRSPAIVLDNLAKQSSPSYVFERVYRNLYNPAFFVLAYEELYNKAIDAHDVRIERLIKRLQNGSYRPQPLTDAAPSVDDAVVQHVMYRLMNAMYAYTCHASIYCPAHEEHSHGALLQAQQQLAQAHWWMQGELHDALAHMDAQKLMACIRQNVQDEPFLQLLWKWLKAGVLTQWRYGETYSGTPRSSKLGWLLAHLYLHALDAHIAAYSKQANALKMAYIRYGSSFVIGIQANKRACVALQQDVESFLTDVLCLPRKKPLSVQPSYEPLAFLGYELICKDKAHCVLYIPKACCQQHLRAYHAIERHEQAKQWKAVYRPYLLQQTDAAIVRTYNAEIVRLYYYYQLAHNVYVLRRFHFMMTSSLYKTFAAKYRTTVRQIEAKFGKQGRFTVKAREQAVMLHDGQFKPAHKSSSRQAVDVIAHVSLRARRKQ